MLFLYSTLLIVDVAFLCIVNLTVVYLVQYYKMLETEIQEQEEDCLRGSAATMAVAELMREVMSRVCISCGDVVR